MTAVLSTAPFSGEPWSPLKTWGAERGGEKERAGEGNR